MEASELRIGNCISFDGEMYIVNSLCFDPLCSKIHVHVVEKLGDIPIAVIGDIEPVQLTNDILLKYGFQKNENGYDNQFVELSYGKFLMGYDEDEKLYLSINSAEYGISDEIRFVHQLQNLFYYLTGEELNINL